MFVNTIRIDNITIFTNHISLLEIKSTKRFDENKTKIVNSICDGIIKLNKIIYDVYVLIYIDNGSKIEYKLGEIKFDTEPEHDVLQKDEDKMFDEFINMIYNNNEHIILKNN